jgi:hypothetical protein
MRTEMNKKWRKSPSKTTVISSLDLTVLCIRQGPYREGSKSAAKNIAEFKEAKKPACRYVQRKRNTHRSINAQQHDINNQYIVFPLIRFCLFII